MASKTLLVLAIPPLGQALASARPAVRGRAVEIAIGSQHQRAHWRIPVGVMENVQCRQRGRGHQGIVGEQTQANSNGEKCDAFHNNFISWPLQSDLRSWSEGGSANDAPASSPS